MIDPPWRFDPLRTIVGLHAGEDEDSDGDLRGHWVWQIVKWEPYPEGLFIGFASDGHDTPSPDAFIISLYNKYITLGYVPLGIYNDFIDRVESATTTYNDVTYTAGGIWPLGALIYPTLPRPRPLMIAIVAVQVDS